MDDGMTESSEEYESNDDDGAFEAPPVVRQDTAFSVMRPAECLAQAQQHVLAVTELLCCSAEVATVLLRHFRWDRDKLTEGGSAQPDHRNPARTQPTALC